MKSLDKILSGKSHEVYLENMGENCDELWINQEIIKTEDAKQAFKEFLSELSKYAEEHHMLQRLYAIEWILKELGDKKTEDPK